jgi:hypothetical protein
LGKRLKSWLIENGHNLTPSKVEVAHLARELECGSNEIRKWFKNRRYIEKKRRESELAKINNI